jgi:hypothetical protein
VAFPIHEVVFDDNPKPPEYPKLCAEGQDLLRKDCQAYCKKIVPACLHWQVGPHVYEEWGTTVHVGAMVVTENYCETVEMCRCTTEIE